MTPLQKQYNQIKAQYEDAILFFRMGDFYEGFGEDAKIMAKVLGITLTSRNKKKDDPMAGIPHHALDSYLYKMVQAGYKVAICEQLEDARKTKGIVKRGVVKVITPGTVTDEKAIDAAENNYILALNLTNEKVGLAYADINTGEFRTTEITLGDKIGMRKVIDEINRRNPSEILVSKEDQSKLKESLGEVLNYYIQFLDDEYFEATYTRGVIENFFEVNSLKGFGIENRDLCISASGGLLGYLQETQKNSLSHIKNPTFYNLTDRMLLDSATMRNLELVFSIGTGSKRGSLIGVLDKTQTTMGARLLRSWILQPLIDKEKIIERLEAVDSFVQDPEINDKVRNLLANVYDLERLASKLGSQSANPKDLLALRNSLEYIPEIADAISRDVTSDLAIQLRRTSCKVSTNAEPDGRDALQCVSTNAKSDDKDVLPARPTSGQCVPTKLIHISSVLQTKEFEPLIKLLEESIDPQAPIALNEGEIIRGGYDKKLDEIREAARGGKDWLKNLQKEEIEKTGINSLKVKFNKVFGYFIEVSRSNLDKVPDNYIRKQTLVNSERFITEELKEMEEKILGAEEKMITLEYELFAKIREQAAEYIGQIQELAYHIAQLDVLANFAYVARYNNYVKPEINGEGLIEIKDGRHPVVEELSQEAFVPNDTTLDKETKQLVILTGPNMSGKSTYIRQVALIVLMAQIGSFVPARSAKIGVTDRIFTRVGASDNLAQGESTFMVEMNETANILNNATEKSLIILDEVGRGTSTYDGVSIAWAVAEYIHNEVGACTLFATHYHELIKLEQTLDRVANVNVAVKEINAPLIRGERGVNFSAKQSGVGEKKEIIFLRKIVDGGTDQSYGVHVAQLAGIPDEVVSKAKEILSGFEQESMIQIGVPLTSETDPSPDKGRLGGVLKNDNPLNPLSSSPLLSGGQAADRYQGDKAVDIEVQPSFFSSPDPKWEKMKEELGSLDLENMTPLEAMKKLEEMKKNLE